MSEWIDLDPTAESVAMARRWSTTVLAQVGAHELGDTTALLVSELVSNVVLHAHTPCRVSIGRDGARVRVEVLDGSDALPGREPDADPLSASGRGMVLVDGLSDRCGVDRRPEGGKRVWFELLVPDAR